MNDIIRDYYEKIHTLPTLTNQKVEKFNNHPDIRQEFEYWIINKSCKPDAISVEGYSAERLMSLSPYLKGEGAYILLIELRDNPPKALARIKNGFKKK